MNDRTNNPKDIVRQLKKSLKEIFKKSDHFYSSLKDIVFNDDQSLKQKITSIDQLLKSSQEKWLTHIMMEEKYLFPLLRSKMPKVKEAVLSLQKKCKTIKVNFEVVQYLCWKLTSGGSGIKRSTILRELETSGKKLAALIDSYFNLETEYLNLVKRNQLASAKFINF